MREKVNMGNLHMNTIINAVMVAERNFKDDGALYDFVDFILGRFGNSYLTRSYLQEWANRVKQQRLDKMDSHTKSEYDRVYGGAQ
jgi:hypothetical protein